MAKDKLPQRTRETTPQARSSTSEIDAFVQKAASANPVGAGRLIFALDATMSRQPTWDRACQIQAAMFDAVSRVGKLAVQLVYFRGFGECRASKWVMSATSLAGLMTAIDCRGGHTQIGKVLSHAVKENAKAPVAALVFIGDAMEENVDALCAKAGEMGLKNLPAFMFHEGGDPVAGAAFREIARLSGGAYHQLTGTSPAELERLLRAVAVYASGGKEALRLSKANEAQLLLAQLRR